MTVIGPVGIANRVIIGTNIGTLTDLSSTGNPGDVLTSQGPVTPPIFQPVAVPPPPPPAIIWLNISASQSLNVNHGYICSAGGALSLNLPPVSTIGDIIEITLDGSASFTVTQNGGQTIKFASLVTTAGVGGSLASTQQGDTLRMVCSKINLRWNILSADGNLTIV